MTEEEIKLIEETRDIIEKYKDLDGGMDVIQTQMNKVYRYFKKAITFCNFNEPRILEVFKLERMLKDKFLPLKSEPEFDKEREYVLPSAIRSEEDAIKVMNFIVHNARMFLSEHHDLKTDSLEARCIDTSFMVQQICQKNNISQKTFSCADDLSGGFFHCFNFVTIPLENGSIKRYLVDCTYRQFFTYADSFLERIGMPLNNGPSMGSYMLMDEDRKKIAEELLVKGYIELTPEVVKSYFDAFVFSGRNGLYYETLGKQLIEKSDYEPNYTVEEYLDALYGEGLKNEKYIMRQKSPLKMDIIFDSGEIAIKTK